MFSVYIAAAALVFTVVGATWKLSAMLAALTESIHTLQATMKRLSAGFDRHAINIAEHEGRIDRVEEDVKEIRRNAA